MVQDDQKSQVTYHSKKNENEQGRVKEHDDLVPILTPTVDLREENDECFHYLDSPSYCS